MLRPYQKDVVSKVHTAWEAGNRGVMIVMGTGTGKTVTFCDIVSREQGVTLVAAHRAELLAQMSLTLARYGIRHRILAPAAVRRTIEQQHIAEFGRRWVDQKALCGVGSVQSLVRSDDEFLKNVKLAVFDEAQHVLRENLWGRVAAKLSDDCRLLLPTASPCRADGKGLGSHSHGLADIMIPGPTMRESINDGFLCDYRVFAPPASNLDLESVRISASGDYSPAPLAQAVEKSSILGDVVMSYLAFAPGLRGITFADSVDHARRISDGFNEAGVPAVVLTADSDARSRSETMRKFRAGELLQIVNVDLLGEGVDVPACGVVSFARPTMSLSLYIQQFGRVLRLMLDADSDMSTRGSRLDAIASSGKPRGIIIDHVGNVAKHGLPDAPRRWTLDARSGTAKKSMINSAIPLRVCLNTEIQGGCLAEYERVLPACPVCGFVPEPAARSSPAEVDGDLIELSPEVLAALRGEAERIMSDEPPKVPFGADAIVVASVYKRHRQRKEAQAVLGNSIAQWRGSFDDSVTDSEAYKRFFWKFGIDVATARTLGRSEAESLNEKIISDLQR